jgi:hypothetical protein
MLQTAGTRLRCRKGLLKNYNFNLVKVPPPSPENIVSAIPFYGAICRAGHFRYKYRYFDIRYLSDTEKSIEISDLKSIGVSCIVLQTFTSDIRYSYVYRGKSWAKKVCIEGKINCLENN